MCPPFTELCGGPADSEAFAPDVIAACGIPDTERASEWFLRAGEWQNRRHVAEKA